MKQTGEIHLRSLTVTEDEVGRKLFSTRVGDAVYQGYLSGANATVLKAAAGNSLETLRQIGGGFLAKLGVSFDPGAQGDEHSLLAGRRVLFALRNGESAAATVDWLGFHKSQGVSGALIFDRSKPREAHAFAKALGDEMRASKVDAPVVVLVHATQPMGRNTDPDARRAAFAPGARARNNEDLGAPNPWHAPLSETILLEALRRRFLGLADAVAFLNVSDLLLMEQGNAFDLALETPGMVVPLVGRELYPWRLRRRSHAPHHDHIYGRMNEERWLSRWCVAPRSLSENAVWRPTRIGGASVAPGNPARFLRAMGVAFPGVPVSKLVDKSVLIEDQAAVAALKADQKPAPLRRQKRENAAPMKSGGITVITAMKNEGPFILDWLAHNRVIGVDNFLIYSNDCSDGTDILLAALAKEGVVQHRENRYRTSGGVPQHAAFRASQSEEIVKNAGWLLTLDIDEYINIHCGEGRLADLIAAVPHANVISMPWRLFGSADRVEFEDRPVARQFRNCAPEYAPRPHQAWGFKTLFQNTGLFRRLGVHRPRGMAPAMRDDVRWIDGCGRRMPMTLWQAGWRMTEACWGYDLVTINHYAVRSAQSFLVKRDRGRVNHVSRDQGLGYWFRMNQNGGEDRSIDRYSALVAAERKRLAAIAGVAEAHAKAVKWHRSKTSELLQVSENQQFFDTITGDRMRRLSRMLEHFGSGVFFSGPQVIPEEILKKDPGGDWKFTVPQGVRQD